MARSRIGSAFAVALVVAACGDDAPAGGSSGSSGSSGSTTLGSAQMSGVATFYDYSGSGGVACGFDVTPGAKVSAIDTAEFAAAASCGSCVDVSGPNGKVTVQIVDQCPDCGANHLDLSAEAFAKIADPKAGRVTITYQLVACTVTGNLSYRFKEGSSQYWTAIQVRNHKLPITKLEYKKAGAYVEMKRSDYNYFIDASGVGEQPNGLDLRVTAAGGQVVEDHIPSVQESKVFAGSAQFK